MKKNNKNYLIFLFLFFSILFSFSKTFANENINFLSLKKDEANLRQGPSFEYPIKLIYNKKYLPLIILDKSSKSSPDLSLVSFFTNSLETLVILQGFTAIILGSCKF